MASCSYRDISPMDTDEDELLQSENDSTEEDDLDAVPDVVQLTDNADFTARAYQIELFKCARKKNSILVLGTGSGKTFISILLIKEFADQIRGPMCEGNKRTVFVVNTVPLVYQQGGAIETHTALKVGKYEGSMGVDYWDDKKWAEELESHEVLVVTAQILLELILHARLPLRRVNLLIVDECHHAVGNHPMREIMREYDALKRSEPDECPRIMGLTASVINRKCGKNEVPKSMHVLEMTMYCALVTSEDQEEVLRFTTRPKEKLVMFREDAMSEYQVQIDSQLKGLLIEIEEMEDIDKKIKKFIAKRIKNIKFIMESLGDWCVARAVYYEMESLEESAEAEDIPVLRDLFVNLRIRFRAIYDECVQIEAKMGNPKDHVSHQVGRLIEVLSAIKEEKVSGLIFVERRNTAKILYDFLLELARQNHDMSFVKPLYVVGANTRPGIDIKLAELELRKQRETLKRFRDGEANFIVSTSVLEEGVDIRKCNAVIRFDKPMNYRAYVQSRGRARAVPSRYILMVNENSHLGFITDLDVYREIEKTLVSLCHDRDLPTNEEIQEHFDQDEIIPPYQPYGPQGPKVTANSAISLINHYCGKLPQDKFTVLAPDVIFKKCDELVQAGILLPTCASLKIRTYGDTVENKDLAKKSAALQLCRTLHRMGELDDKLRPAVPSSETFAEGLLDVELEPKREGQPELGTKKHRQIYEREICKSFSFVERGTFHLYSIEIQPVGQDFREVVVDSTNSAKTLGIICKKELVHCPFSLYGAKFGEVDIKIQHLKLLHDISLKEIEKIKHFHKLTMESLFHINTTLMEFNPQEFNHGVFIVPLTGNCISVDLVDELSPLTTIRADVSRELSQRCRFERSSFQDAIIYPLYGEDREQLYYVTGIMNHLNPTSEFPENKLMYENYEGYFNTKYGARITNRQQPLIGAKHLPKELNYLKKVPLKKKSTRDPPYFIPELCGVIPLKASLWWQLSCIPSILYRLNSFGVAHRLSIDVGVRPILGSDYADSVALDFKWAERIAQNSISSANLTVDLEIKRNEHIYPFMLSHALTLLGTGDGYNLERLEVLGDSFLKYVAGEYVFLKFPNDHEGRLSPRRTILVCNKTLFQLAREKSIPNVIHAVNLKPKVNGIIPGWGVKKSVERRLYNLELPHDKWHKLDVPDNLSDLKQVVEQLNEDDVQPELGEGKNTKPAVQGSCYNPWREQEVSDKSAADCVEAIIGAYLLKCGSDAAKDFLHWIGIGVHEGRALLKDTLPIPSAVLKDNQWSKQEVNGFYKKACLDRLEDIIQYKFRDRSFIVQAVTHASYSQNRTTDNYQRLEFIGDAVLDYLVTGLIYSHHTSYTPGQMTDLRSYYVNNETLAKVAAKFELQRHLLHMAPKLQATIDKFLTICKEEGGLERELVTEEDEDDVDEIEVPKSLGDLIEAIIGAVYLDSNRSLQITWAVVTTLMGDAFKKKHKDIPKNCVRQLYEAAPKVEFKKVPHENGFPASYIVRINDIMEVRGNGKNFKVAKDHAAKKALRRLQEMRDQAVLPQVES